MTLSVPRRRSSSGVQAVLVAPCARATSYDLRSDARIGGQEWAARRRGRAGCPGRSWTSSGSAPPMANRIDLARGRDSRARRTGTFQQGSLARRLVISPKTVGNHIEHIYTKSGCSSRAETGLFTMRHGLLSDSARRWGKHLMN